MTLVRRQLRSTGLMLAAMLGNFGNDTRPQDLYDPQEIRGFKRGKTKGRQEKSGNTRTGYSRKRHRRSYLCGRPAFRHASI